MDPLEPTDLDPAFAGACAQARRAFTRARSRWTEGDAAEEALDHAIEALARLDAGAFDEAESLAEAALELDEGAHDGRARAWRDFALCIQEAAAIGRGE